MIDADNKNPVCLSSLIEQMNDNGDYKNVYYRYKQLSQSRVKDMRKSKSDVNFDRAVLINFRKHQCQLVKDRSFSVKKQRIFTRGVEVLLKQVDANSKFRDDMEQMIIKISDKEKQTDLAEELSM